MAGNSCSTGTRVETVDGGDRATGAVVAAKNIKCVGARDGDRAIDGCREPPPGEGGAKAPHGSVTRRSRGNERGNCRQ